MEIIFRYELEEVQGKNWNQIFSLKTETKSLIKSFAKNKLGLLLAETLRGKGKP
jgi:hypothetical protein